MSFQFVGYVCRDAFRMGIFATTDTKAKHTRMEFQSVDGCKGGSNLAATLVNAILCFNDAEQLAPGRDV